MTGSADEAAGAIQDALGSERPLAVFPPDVREKVIGLVADGLCTGAEAAEALVLAYELADAKEAGEITDSQGVEVMVRLGVRHRDGGGRE